MNNNKCGCETYYIEARQLSVAGVGAVIFGLFFLSGCSLGYPQKKIIEEQIKINIPENMETQEVFNCVLNNIPHLYQKPSILESPDQEFNGKKLKKISQSQKQSRERLALQLQEEEKLRIERLSDEQKIIEQQKRNYFIKLQNSVANCHIP